MKNIFVIHDVVKKLLEEKPYTRNSDMSLYAEVVAEINPQAKVTGIYYALNNHNSLGLPPFESVSRARRKLQKEYPELRAIDSVTDERYENWKAVREYVAQ